MTDSYGAGYDRFTAAVRSCEDVNESVFLVYLYVGGYHFVVNLERNARVVYVIESEHGLVALEYLGLAKIQPLIVKRAQKRRALDDKFYLGHNVEQKIRVFKHVALNYLLPGAKRLLVNVVYCRVEGKRERRSLIFRLLFSEGNEICDAGILVVFEIEAEYLFEHVS